MSVFVIFTLMVVVGAVLLAHHMGKEIGEEEGYVRAWKASRKCPSCGDLLVRDTLSCYHDR